MERYVRASETGIDAINLRTQLGAFPETAAQVEATCAMVAQQLTAAMGVAVELEACGLRQVGRHRTFSVVYPGPRDSIVVQYMIRRTALVSAHVVATAGASPADAVREEIEGVVASIQFTR